MKTDLSHLWSYPDVSLTVRGRVDNSPVKADLLYACETWTLHVKDSKKTLCSIIGDSDRLLTFNGNIMLVVRRFGNVYVGKTTMTELVSLSSNAGFDRLDMYYECRPSELHTVPYLTNLGQIGKK